MSDINEKLRQQVRADRRERIATACMAALISSPEYDKSKDITAYDAVQYADTLIAELDEETAP